MLCELRRYQGFLTPRAALGQSLHAKAGKALATPARFAERVAFAHEVGLQVPAALLGHVRIRQASAYFKAGEHERGVGDLFGW